MLYNLAISIYLLGVRVAAFFRPKSKAAHMVRGHRQVFGILKRQLDPKVDYIWFHAASLGEFEQGRPLIEWIRANHPEYRILQTFFSPSGYEVRKDYSGADVVCYLPLDTPINAYRFVEAAHPRMAFFVKYEFWRNYLNRLHKKRIPVYSVSSVFRPNQIFFRWYGRDYRNVLKSFTHLFVQNQLSKDLLSRIGITNTTIVGDTRFDRVLDIYKAAKLLPIVELFKQDKPTIVAGSSWSLDEELLVDYFNNHPEIKLIIAPHVVNEERLAEIESKLKRPYVLYTQAGEEKMKRADCLIIDGYGLLSSIYRYGEIAYVGGGFGAGIHNVLEAAVYGIPVVFGPNNRKFREARHLLEVEGGFEVQDTASFSRVMDRLLIDKDFLEKAGRAAGDYVRDHSGALHKILKKIEF